MLAELRIQGLGVIVEATLALDPGLTVVSGETGAGKTMVVTGLQLLFGGRAEAARVRTESARAWVEGRLRLAADSDPVRRAIESGAELDADGSLLVSRSVSTEGRSRAHLGGRTVPVGVLAELGGDVLALHGQAGQTQLLRPAEQRAALDRYAGAPATDLARHYAETYTTWRALTEDLARRRDRTRERTQEAELLRHGLAVIEVADPQPGEEQSLAAEASRLTHADTLRYAARTAHEALVGDPTGDGADVSGLLGTARRALTGALGHDDDLAELDERLAEVGYLAADVATDLASYAERIDADPHRLQWVLDRRAVLQDLLRGYGDTVPEVLAWAAAARTRLEELDSSEDTLADLAARRDAAAESAAALASRLSAARTGAAERFGAEVSAELTGLAMPDARVYAEVRRRRGTEGAPELLVDGSACGAGPDGVDDVELLLAAHPGAPAQPLQRGASGGELSRVMLAVEVVFAAADPVPIMVFDEVDAGIGGRAAVEVGRRLARLARDHQVLVVTHLPQVAAYADTHLVVDKSLAGGGTGEAVTHSAVRSLDGPAREQELARMLAGLDGSEHARAHARELLTAAADDRGAAAEDRRAAADDRGAGRADRVAVR